MEFLFGFIKSMRLFFDSENKEFIKIPFEKIKHIYSDVYTLVSRVGTDYVKNSNAELERCIKESLPDVISLKEMLLSAYQKNGNVLECYQFWSESIDFLETVEYLLKPKKYIMTTEICKNSLGDIFDAQQDIVDYTLDKTLLQLYREYSIYYCDKLTDQYKKVCNAYHSLLKESRRNIRFLLVFIIIAALLCFLWKTKS